MAEVNSLTVLVVGKQAKHVSELIGNLESLGCRVICSEGITQWVRPAIAACDVPLVFCDLDLDKGSYADLIDNLRSAGRRTKLVVTSRQCRMADYLEAMQVGAYDYLCPPFEATELTRIVRNASCVRLHPPVTWQSAASA